MQCGNSSTTVGVARDSEDPQYELMELIVASQDVAPQLNTDLEVEEVRHAECIEAGEQLYGASVNSTAFADAVYLVP